jgi:hypothetical protein
MIAASPQIQRLHPTARNRGFLVGPADRTRMVRRLGPVENDDAGEAFATTSTIINECHPFSSPPFGLGVGGGPHLLYTLVFLSQPLTHHDTPSISPLLHSKTATSSLPVRLHPLCLVSAYLLTTRCCVTSANQATRVVRP